MPFGEIGKQALMRAAQRHIEQAQAATAAEVKVLWQRSTEDGDAFASRVMAARINLHRDQLLVCVCAYGVMSRSYGVCVIELPPKMLELFDSPKRYRGCYGGRGRGASWTFTRAMIARALERKTRILCAREFQNSIADSIHTLLSDQIELLGLSNYFEVQNASITSRNGSEFLFAGLRTNVSKIKSFEGCQIVFVEEAVNVSDNSWQVLIPTIRAVGSEIWLGWNSDLATDPTHIRFVVSPPPNSIIIKSSYLDNPWFGPPLSDEMEHMRRTDTDAFDHVWLGGLITHSNAQIFRGKYSVESFEPGKGWNGPYFGADWGFSQDPTTLVKCWINGRVLYVEYEAYGLGVDIDRTPQMFDAVPGARLHAVRADSARPETISYMQRNGYSQMVSVPKWSGSVEDGIAHLRSYEKIVIHPRCEHAAEEFKLYSFKVDRLSGDVLAEPVDKFNHIIDALRYALHPLIKSGGAESFLAYMATQAKADTENRHPLAPQLATKPGVVVRELTGAWHRE